MKAWDKQQCSIRLPLNEYNKVKAKVAQDQLSFQKLAEVLFLAYLKGNKEITKLIRKYSDEKHDKKRRYALDELEANELLRIIEEKHSPLKDLEDVMKEIDKDE